MAIKKGSDRYWGRPFLIFRELCPCHKRPFDSSNPNHRIRDPELKRKLLSEKAQQQLLTWLVRGAVAWYKNKDFTSQPPLIRDAFNKYNAENDKLQQFIDTYCEIGVTYYVNASAFREELLRQQACRYYKLNLVSLWITENFHPPHLVLTE